MAEIRAEQEKAKRQSYFKNAPWHVKWLVYAMFIALGAVGGLLFALVANYAIHDKL